MHESQVYAQIFICKSRWCAGVSGELMYVSHLFAEIRDGVELGTGHILIPGVSPLISQLMGTGQGSKMRQAWV